MSTCTCARGKMNAHLGEIIEVVESTTADHAHDHWHIG
jgi:hypothetical protein